MHRRFLSIAILTVWTTTCFAAKPPDSSDLLKVGKRSGDHGSPTTLTLSEDLCHRKRS